MFPYIKEFFKDADLLRFFLLVFFLISPGIIYFFLWQPVLFINLDWVKLVLLSLSVMVPVTFINTLVSLECEKLEPSKSRRELVESFVMTGAVSGLFGSLVIGATYIARGSLFFNLIILEVLLLIVIGFEAWKTRNKK